LFLWVAGRLNVNPSHTVVFEDAEAGIDAALKGGFWTVGVGAEHNVRRAHLKAPNGLADLDVIQVVQHFQPL
jgi:beta-phosphoglucomutase-like phosphatase (HAD superfamily)